MQPDRSFNPNRAPQPQRPRFTPPPGTPTLPPQPQQTPGAIHQPQPPLQPAATQPPQPAVMSQQPHAAQAPVRRPVFTPPQQQTEPAETPSNSGEQTEANPTRKSTKRSHKKLWVSILLVILVLAGAGAGWMFFGPGKKTDDTTTPSTNATTNQPTGQNETELVAQEYTNSDLGYMIILPENWERYRNPPEGINEQFRSATNPEGSLSQIINITGADATNTNLASIVEAAKSILKEQNQNFQEVETRQVTVGGVPAILMTHTSTISDGTSMTGSQVILVKDNRSYAVTALTATPDWDANKELLQSAILSFQFL